MFLGKEARVSKRLLAGAVGNGVMRCDCRNEQLSKTAVWNSKSSYCTGPAWKIPELAKGKELFCPQARLNEKLSTTGYCQSNKPRMEIPEWVGARTLNTRQFSWEVMCAPLAHRGPPLGPSGLHSKKAVEDQIFWTELTLPSLVLEYKFLAATH